MPDQLGVKHGGASNKARENKAFIQTIYLFNRRLSLFGFYFTFFFAFSFSISPLSIIDWLEIACWPIENDTTLQQSKLTDFYYSSCCEGSQFYGWNYWITLRYFFKNDFFFFHKYVPYQDCPSLLFKDWPGSAKNELVSW